MKETQTEIMLENFSDFLFETHTAEHVDFGVYYCNDILQEQPSCTLAIFETEIKVNVAKRATMSTVALLIMKRTNRLHYPVRLHLSFIGSL